MNAISIFYTPGRIIVVDGVKGAEALLLRLQTSILSGEASGIVIKYGLDGIPLIETYNEAQLYVDLNSSFTAQDWNSLTRDAYAAMVGTVAGAAALSLGPAGMVLAEETASAAFKKAYDAASDWSKSHNLPDLLDDLIKDFWDGLGDLAKDISANEGFKDMKEAFMLGLDLWGRQYVIDPRTNDLFGQSRNWRPAPVDPLLFDLDNDGIETVGLNGAKSILFDSNGDGVKTATGWAGKDDGLLVWDRNGNGQIDSGRELFGDATVKTNGERARDGLDALADLDSNGDGVISALDALWNELKIWQDTNQDGVSQTNELKSLNELGFQAIKLTPSGGVQTQANGNQITASAGYTKTDGTSGTYGNLNLVGNDFYREFTDKITLSDSAKSLANMQGAGAVRDLREAMSLSNPLTQDVAALISPT